MGWAKVAVVTERWQPMASMDVEAYDLDNPTTVVDVVQTDTGGVANFTSLPNTGRYFFKPRATRSSGVFGEKSLYGAVKTQILSSSANMQCADAVVDASGMFGTHTTIQSVIDQYNASTGRFKVYIFKGTYAETLSFAASSSSHWHFLGCGGRNSELQTLSAVDGTVEANSLGVIIDNVAALAVDYAGLTAGPDVVFESIWFKSSGAAVLDLGRGSVRLVECIVENTGAGHCIVGTGLVGGTGPDLLSLESCRFEANTSNYAANFHGASLKIVNCHINGAIEWYGDGGVIISHSALTSSNGTATIGLMGTLVIADFLAAIVGNVITNTGAGDGIRLNSGGVAAASGYFTITGNQIIGGAGTGVNANDDDLVGVITGNVFKDWAAGVSTNSAGLVVVLVNQYENVTDPISTNFSALNSDERAANGLVGGTGSEFTNPVEGALIVGQAGGGGWDTINPGAANQLLAMPADGTDIPAWRSPSDISGIGEVLLRHYIPIGSETEGGHGFAPSSGAGVQWTQFGNAGRLINPSAWPDTVNTVLEFSIASLGGGVVYARLYDSSTAAAVVGSELSTTATAGARTRSGLFTLASAAREYIVQIGCEVGETVIGYDAVLVFGDASLEGGTPAPANPGDEEMANEIMNFPSLEGADDAQPEWWEESAGTATLTEVDVAGEAGITESYERALKMVTTADVYGYQTYTYADQQRLKSGNTVSVRVAVWAVGGVTARVRLQSTVGSLGVATTTAAAWTVLEVEGVVLDGTAVDLRFEVATGTAYFIPLGFSVASTASTLRPRGLRYVIKDPSVDAVLLTGASDSAFADVDVSANTHNLAAMVQLLCALHEFTAANDWQLYIRRNGSAEGEDLRARATAVAASTDQIGINSINILLDDQQVFEWSLNRSAGATTLDAGQIAIRGYWMWE